MITLDEVRNARLQDIFFVTLVKEYTWEEVEENPISIEGLPSEITVNSILKILNIRLKKDFLLKIMEIKEFLFVLMKEFSKSMRMKLKSIIRTG